METGTGLFNVRDYGASGNGCGKDTRPVQQAVDACHAAGGGTVLLPAGVYLSGTIYLRDNVCLELAPGATLLGSTDPADYNADDFCPQNGKSTMERASGAHLVVGLEVKNITIRGGGRIDGNGPKFFSVPEEAPDRFEIPGWRPGQMIFLCECEDVRIEGVELCNAAYWTCFLYGCERVFVRGVRVWNDRRTINGDGIDIDCCRQVLVSDCLVESGDDCLTLRGNNRRLKNQRPCEDVVVTNCILKSRAHGVRVGVGSGVIRRAVFSNLVLGGWGGSPALGGICIQSNYCTGSTINRDHAGSGTEIHDLRFMNIQMADVLSALYVSPGAKGGKSIRNIYFHNLHARVAKGSLIKGSPENPTRRVVLSHVDIHTCGRADLLLAPERWETPTFEWDGCRPAALYMADCEDVKLDHLRLDWGETSGEWRHALWIRRVRDVRLTGCRLRPPPGADTAVRRDDVVVDE